MGSTVNDMLRAKASGVLSIRPDQMVIDVATALSDHRVGALPVIDGDTLVGIISERDCVRKLILQELDAKTTPVTDLMTKDPITVTVDHTVGQCMGTMSSHYIRHLPVVDDGGKVIGVVAVDDVLKAMIRDQEQDLQALESLIKDDEGGSG